MKSTTLGLLLFALVASSYGLEVSYANFFDVEPRNNYPMLVNSVHPTAPIAHPSARISYSNFYDANPMNDFPVIVDMPAIPRVLAGVRDVQLDYSNFLDKNPYNDFVIVQEQPVVRAPWNSPVISYENFYDNNPFNDYAIIVEAPIVQETVRVVETVPVIIEAAPAIYDEYDEVEYVEK